MAYLSSITASPLQAISTPLAILYGGLIAFYLFSISTLALLARWRPDPFARVLVRGLSWGPVYLFFMGGTLLGKEILTAGCLLLSLRALHELLSIGQAPAPKAAVLLVAAGCTVTHYAALCVWPWRHALFIAPVACVTFLPLVVFMQSRRQWRERYRSILFALVLSTLCLGCLPAICWLPWRQADTATRWSDALFLVVATPQVSDCFQYLVGKWKGKRLLWPETSPSKTWEGAIGGCLLTLLCMLPFTLAITSLSLLEAALLDLALCVLGILGDLLLSRVKRRADVKDFPLLLPEFGGALDRVDSLVLCAPFFLLFARSALV